MCPETPLADCDQTVNHNYRDPTANGVTSDSQGREAVKTLNLVNGAVFSQDEGPRIEALSG